MAFLPGITVEGATRKEGGKVSGGLSTFPPLAAHRRRKTRGRSLHSLPLQARRTGRGGDMSGAAPPRLSQPTRGIRANPCPIRLSRQSPDHNSKNKPSEREALWWSNA